MKKYALGMSLCLSVVLAVSAQAAPPGVPDASEVGKLLGGAEAGVQLNRTREYLEQERVARQIAEDKKRKQKVEAEEQVAQEGGAEVRFTLKKIDVDKSEIFTAEEMEVLTKEYLAKEISLQDLYALVNKINALYQEKGYLTCRAFLPPQTIKDGVVSIQLVEGKVGQVILQGNKTTREKYVTNRIGLKNGTINNVNDLNKDLLRFNGTNDAQLRIAMKAGEVEGTTDYILSLYEPKRDSFNLYVDNAGSKNSGEWREGLFYTNKSLFHRRDALTLSTLESQGTKSFSGAYTTNVGRSGTKLGVNYSNNSVHIKKGEMRNLDVRGHSTAYGLSLTQPLLLNEKARTEVSLEYGHQNSTTDLRAVETTWVDDAYNNYTLAFSATDYGKSHIFYHKYGYRYTDFDGKISDTSDKFGKLIMNMIYQKGYEHGQLLSGRLNAQFTNHDYVASSEQFYIGGAYSVRGYEESLLNGDKGFSVSAEYAVPVDKEKRTSVFGFLDYGYVAGPTAYGDRMLLGTGVGVRTTFAKNISASLTLGLPLNRTVNTKEVDKGRLHFMLNGQF